MGRGASAAEQVRWFIAPLCGGAVPDAAAVRARMAPSLLRRESAETLVQEMAAFVAQAGRLSPPSIEQESDAVAHATATDAAGRRWVLECRIEAGTGLVEWLQLQRAPHLQGLDIAGFASTALEEPQRRAVHRLFDACYARANHDYLDRQLSLLATTAIATYQSCEIGFAIADVRRVDLPQLPDEVLVMSGLSCVVRDHRRHGLMGLLQNAAVRHALAVRALDTAGRGRTLQAGRVAHPASMRGFRLNPTSVPRPGSRPTPWQQAVGAAVAAEFAVAAFDGETFVCTGDGRPVGDPILDLEVSAEEWDVFRPVDRSRGDALLAIAWTPSAPDGWQAAE